MTKIKILSALILVFMTMLMAGCKPAATPVSPTATITSFPPTETPLPPSPLPPTKTPVETETPISSAPTLIVLDMKTISTGWALTYTSVVRTHDGGETWVDVSPAEWDDSMVPSTGFFLDENQAWLLQTDPVDFERGVFFRTSDGGTTWTHTGTPFGAGPISFINESYGWVMTGLGAGAGSQAIAIFATRDGGAAWREVYRRDTGDPEPAGEIPLSGQKQGITFRDELHGWVAGSVPADNFVYLYATNNRGSNFQQQDIPLPSGIDTAMLSLEAPLFFSQDEGVLPALAFTPDLTATVLYTTNDGGQTWSPTTPVPMIGSFSIPTWNDFIVWDGNLLYSTNDAGQSWVEITPNINLDQMIAQLDFVDSDNGWVTWMDGDGNTGLYRTSDGGATWTALLP